MTYFQPFFFTLFVQNKGKNKCKQTLKENKRLVQSWKIVSDTILYQQLSPIINMDDMTRKCNRRLNKILFRRIQERTKI